MVETKSKVIGGVEYNVTQLTAKKGTRVLTRLLKVLGPAAMGGGESGQMMSGLFERLSEDDVEFFCETFAATTTVTLGDKCPQLNTVFELHFTGKYSDMLQWLLFALEVNFSSFFGASLGAGVGTQAQ